MHPYEGIHVSARSFSSYQKLLGLEDAAFRNVLDVGSGLSGFVSGILSLGIDALGLDVGYSAVESMAIKYLEQPIPITLQGLKDKYRNRVVSCDSYDEAKNVIFVDKCMRIADFLKQFEEHKGNYLAGTVFNLPFSDNSFDLAVSVELLGRESYFTSEQFLAGIKEMTRVASEARVYSYSLNINTSFLSDNLPGLNVSRKNDNLVIIS